MTPAARIYWLVGVMAAGIIGWAFLFPGDPPKPEDLPWHIEHSSPSESRIFGLDLGKSTPSDAEYRFREKTETTLFRAPSGQLSAEVFFEQIDLAGLRAKIVVTVDCTPEELQAMYERGLRMAGTASGKKITLTYADEQLIRNKPISSLTYMPALRIEPEVFVKRFGEPQERWQEKETAVTHLLYPQHGLDIILSEDSKPVLQFVRPDEFTRLRAPLEKNAVRL